MMILLFWGVGKKIYYYQFHRYFLHFPLRLVLVLSIAQSHKLAEDIFVVYAMVAGWGMANVYILK